MDLFKLENTSVSGNPVVLEDCAKAPLHGLTVYGKSTQVTTTGAQLIDINSFRKDDNYSVKIVNNYSIELTSTIEKDASDSNRVYSNVLIDADILVGKTITMSYDEWNSNVPNETAIFGIMYDLNGGTKYYQINTASKIETVTIPLDAKNCRIRLFLVENASGTVKAGTYTAIIKGLMICEGTVAKSWEPYTGGKPSPSPDYPQEIVSALGNFTVRGKNIYDSSIQWGAFGWSGTVRNTQNKVTVTAKNGWVHASFLSPVKGETVTFSCTYKQTETTSKDTQQALCIVTTPNEKFPNDNNIVYQTISPNTNETTISATFISNTYIGIFLRVETEGIGLTRTVELTNIQLEYGSKATSYEPYKGSTSYTFAPNGLPGIPVSVNGNYTDQSGQQWICDELDFERGVYRQRIKHVNVVFKKEASSSTHSGYRHMAGDIKNLSREYTECLCNIATHSQNAAYGTEGVRASGAYNALVLYYENLTLDNVPADVAYILSDPIETPLTQSQIETYKSLHTYDGTTIIESPDSAGLSAVYGRKIYMANTTLKTRIILNNKTTDEWAQNGSFVGLKGEFLVDTVTRKIKIGDGATAYTDLEPVNLTPEEVQELIKNASHTHSNKSILDATTASFTTALLEKLNGIATGANKTVVDDALSNTSTNPVQNKAVKAAIDGKVPTSRKVNGKALTGDITLSADDVKAIPSSQKGAANGVATLDANGHIPSNMLPSSVDEILEGYISDDAATFYKDAKKSSAYTAETSKIYVDLTSEKIYRWSGSKYSVISETIALGETSTTAFDGFRGKKAYDHSQSAHAPSNAERNIIVGIQKNGADVAPDGSRKVNITVPTKTSQITNDSGFITSGATTAKAKQLETARKIDGVGFDGTADITHFATCSTAAATQAKTASVAGFNLVTGARVTIKFTVTNTAANPTLNVNGTGAKAIKYRGAAIATGYLAANRVYEFVYDGTDYLFMGDINTDSNTTYSAGSGLQLSGTQFKHKNAVTAGTAKGDDNKTLSFGGTFKVPSVSYDTEGHITGSSSTTMTMPAAPTSVSGNAGSATKLANARNFSITGGATAAAVSFNGTADVSLNVTSLNAAKLALAEGDTLILDGSV